MLIPKKYLRIVLVVFLLLLFTVLILILFKGSRKDNTEKEDFLIEIPELPQDRWPRKIETEAIQNDYTVIKNTYDKYALTIPNNWSVNKVAWATSGINILYEEEETKNDPHEYDGLQLTILVFKNNENYLLKDWIDRAIEAREFLPEFGEFDSFNHSDASVFSYTTSHVLLEYEYESDIGVPRFDSLMQEFIFQKKQTVYVVTCLATGKNFYNLSIQCADQIPSFTILD